MKACILYIGSQIDENANAGKLCTRKRKMVVTGAVGRKSKFIWEL